MTFPFFWLGRRPRVDAEDRLGRLCKVLDQAKIDYLPESAEATLGSLPAARPPLRRKRVQVQRFRFPLSGRVRIALLEGGFETDRDLQEFNRLEFADDAVWLHSYAPEALVAPLDLALSLADRKRRGLFDLPSLRTAIVVLTSVDDSALADHHRELLWRAFGVPIFEQLRAWDSTIVARECEVHDGLHVDEAEGVIQLHEGELLVTRFAAAGDPVIRARTGLTGEIVTSACECGAETARLRSITAMRARAASARA